VFQLLFGAAAAIACLSLSCWS